MVEAYIYPPVHTELIRRRRSPSRQFVAREESVAQQTVIIFLSALPPSSSSSRYRCRHLGAKAGVAGGRWGERPAATPPGWWSRPSALSVRGCRAGISMATSLREDWGGGGPAVETFRPRAEGAAVEHRRPGRAGQWWAGLAQGRGGGRD